MNEEAVLNGLVDFAQDDWLPLWVIVQDVQELLGIDDPDATLEATVAVARALLKRGLLAGESPVSSAVRFKAWADQDPDSVADYIRSERRQRGGLPSWGDCPWFAFPGRRAAA